MPAASTNTKGLSTHHPKPLRLALTITSGREHHLARGMDVKTKDPSSRVKNTWPWKMAPIVFP